MSTVTEVNNKILLKLRNTYQHLTSKIAGEIFGIYCKIVGVNIEFPVFCWGVPSIFRYPNSEIRIGSNCRFRSNPTSNLIGVNHRCIISTLNDDAKITIGKNCGFSGVVIGSFKEISISDNVIVGANCLITDSDWHPLDPRAGNPKPVTIGANVWVGYGSIIMKGVSIGENSVIGAGSVVVKDLPPNVVAAGNPCKIIKEFH